MAVPVTSVPSPTVPRRRADQAWSGPACDDARPRRSPWRGRWRRGRGPAPLLAQVRPFCRYPTKVLDGLGPYADRLTVREGTVVATRGHRAREAIVVLSGEVRALAVGGTPPRSFGPGSWLGPRQILASEPYADTLVAGPGLEVIVLNGPAYRWAAANLPGLTDDTT